MEGQNAYTVEEAAAILGRSPERVQEMLATGELEGIPPGATLAGEWKVLLRADLAGDPGQDEPGEETPQSATEQQEDTSSTGEASEDFVEPPRSAGEIAESEQLSRGDNAATTETPTAPSGWVSTQQAARALGITPRTVRWHIEQGNLEAKPEGEGVKRSWLVSIDSLHTLRDARQATGEVPRSRRGETGHADITPASSGEAIRVLAERLEDAAARAAEYRVRLELTEQAESTLRAELEETRRRREEAERERDRLRRELEALREERRESPVSPGPSDAAPDATEERAGAHEAREATQIAAETLRGPQARPSPGGTQEGLQTPPQAARRRGRLWRRVFGG